MCQSLAHPGHADGNGTSKNRGGIWSRGAKRPPSQRLVVCTGLLPCCGELEAGIKFTQNSERKKEQSG